MATPLHLEHFDVSGCSMEQPFNDFDRGCLTRAIRTEQAKTLADFDSQIEPANGVNRCLALIALHEVAATNGNRHDGDYNCRCGQGFRADVRYGLADIVIKKIRNEC